MLHVQRGTGPWGLAGARDQSSHEERSAWICCGRREEEELEEEDHEQEGIDLLKTQSFQKIASLV